MRVYIVCRLYFTERVVNAGTPQEHTVRDPHVGCPLGAFRTMGEALTSIETNCYPPEDQVIKEFDVW